MTDNTQATIPPQPPQHPQPPEFHSPPPPPGDPPIASAASTVLSSQATTQPTVEPGQYAPPPGPPPGASAPPPVSATEAAVQPNADPFSDTHQTTAAAQLQEPPQHPERPLPTGPFTETPLHSEPAPILPPRPQPQTGPEQQTPPPPRASFDQIPDHPALRQSSLGRAQSPTHSVQRVAMTPLQPQPVAPPPQVPVLDANADTLESDPAISSLHAMFPAFDLLVIQSVLEATGGDRDQAIDSLLSMSDPDYAPTQPHAQTVGGGAPNQGRQPSQTELDEEFARRLMLEEEQQAHGSSWPPQDHQASPHHVPYQTYQSRRSGEHQRPTGTGGGGGGIGDIANDLQQQFKSFIGGTGGRGAGAQSQPQGQSQAGTGAGYQEQLNKFADTGKKTFNSIFNKVKQKMEEFDRQHPPDTQNMNQPPQAGHWSNWQSPDPARQPTQQTTTYAHSPAPAPSQSIPNAWSPPPATPHGALNSNPYGVPPANPNVDTNAATLPTSSGRWNYQPEAAAAPPPPQASAGGTGTGAPEEPRKSIDTSRLGLLPKRPVSLMDVNANTRSAAAPAPVHTTERDSDEESLEYVDRPMPGAMGRPS